MNHPPPTSRHTQIKQWLRRFAGYVAPVADQANVQQTYQQLLVQFQQRMLLPFVGLIVGLSLLFGLADIALRGFVTSDRQWSLLIQALRIAVLLLTCGWFWWQQRIQGAWLILIVIDLLSLLAQIWVQREPALLVFALFSLLVPTLVLSPTTLLLVMGTTLGAFLVLVRWFDLSDPGPILLQIMLFVGFMAGYASVGWRFRQFLWATAVTTVHNEAAAVQRGRLEQRVADLRLQIDQVRVLEHDLRQPLRVTHGYLDLIASDHPDSAACVRLAQAAVQRAERLANNLLDQARFQAGSPALSLERLSLTQMLTEMEPLLPGLIAYYSDPPVTIRWEVREVPLVLAHQDTLERAIWNLLDNALAHTQAPGEVRLSMHATDQYVELTLADDGPGLPTDMAEALVAGHRLPLQHRRGYGLGLGQVLATVQAHQGHVTFASNTQGTAVCIRLPLIEPAA
jgi:signal transduction histidine kinase